MILYLCEIPSPPVHTNRWLDFTKLKPIRFFFPGNPFLSQKKVTTFSSTYTYYTNRKKTISLYSFVLYVYPPSNFFLIMEHIENICRAHKTIQIRLFSSGCDWSRVSGQPIYLLAAQGPRGLNYILSKIIPHAGHAK